MSGRWLVPLALLLTACGGGTRGGDAPQVTAVPVGTAPVRVDTLSETMELSGRLTPLPGASAQLTAPTDAVVRAVPVQVGDRVVAGTLLVDLDAPELTTQARSLHATADAAESDLARQRDLFHQGITARRQLEDREATATGAAAAAAAADRLLARTRVTSPLAGSVQRVLVQPGERVSQGQPLVEVLNGAALDLVVSASPADLARLTVGLVARVSGEGAVDAQVARVHAIAPGVDSVTGSGSVVIRIPVAGHGLRPGGGATAHVVLPLLRNVLIVPDSALVLVGGSTTVFVIGADSVVHGHAVEVQARSGGRTAIRGDVAAGAMVATSGAYGLADGMHVIPSTGHPE